MLTRPPPSVPIQERSIAGGVERKDTVVAQRGRVRAVENDKADAIETDQAAGGADPEIPFAGLGDRLDFVLRKAVFAAPDTAAVLGIRGGGGETEEQRDGEEAAGHPM